MLTTARLRCLEGDYLLLEMKRDCQSEDKQLPPNSLLNHYLSMFFFSFQYVKSLNNGYMKYKANYDNTRCVMFSKTYADNDHQLALYNVSSMTTDNPIIQSRLDIYRVEKCSGGIKIYNTSGVDLLYDLTLLYTNYDDCGILTFTMNHERKLNVGTVC